jgi:hypothetical protein
MMPQEIQDRLAELASPREDISLAWADERVAKAIQEENSEDRESVIAARIAEADHRATGSLAA